MITEATVSVVVGDVDTPVGPLRVAEHRPAVGDDASRAGRVVVLAFADHFDRVAGPVRRRLPGPWEEGRPVALEPVQRYLDGDLTALESLRVDVVGSAFRRRVWDVLRAIPAGETRSYADVARALGAPRAVRAVGSANGANPVWLVVPCHRVVRSDGDLGGYGGGLDRKAWLLAHEREHAHDGAAPGVAAAASSGSRPRLS